MKYILIILASVFLFGCTQNKEDASVIEKRGAARLEVFKQCMELAAKNARKADDDVSDIAKECSNQSYYLTNYIK
jgi:hypothetical protein